jgi:hypothetical protein
MPPKTQKELQTEVKTEEEWEKLISPENKKLLSKCLNIL